APTLLGDATLPHEVDDELELVEHLEVGDLGLVASLDEGLEAVLHELRGTTTENGLLTEQVGLGLLGEGRLDDAGARTTDSLRVGERGVPSGTRCILLDGDDVWDATASDELAAHRVA